MKTRTSAWIPACVIAASLGAMACSTPRKSAAAGAAIGAGAGATAGLLADPGQGGEHRIRNVLIGTGIGGVLGAGAGLLLGNGVESGKQSAFEQGKAATLEQSNAEAASTSGTQPRLVPAKTEARWVPDQIHSNVFIPGHFEYVIIAPSHWSP